MTVVDVLHKCVPFFLINSNILHFKTRIPYIHLEIDSIAIYHRYIVRKIDSIAIYHTYIHDIVRTSIIAIIYKN